MTKEQIDKMFEGRWRIKGKMIGRKNADFTVMSMDEYNFVKDLCRDFFEAGIHLADKEATVPEGSPEGKAVTPHTEVHTSKILPEGSGTPWQEVDPFEYWWKLYDLKVGRDKCEKKWAKLTEKEKAECIAATPAYVRSTPDKQFRKRPLTYLNGKCWNDEIINRNGTNTQPTIEQQCRDKLASILTE